MIKLERCNSNDKSFIELTKALDNYLNSRNGSKQDFYNKFNVMNDIDTVLVMKNDNQAIACGCFKKYNNTTVEIKRMYVDTNFRGHGYSKEILKNLEIWAAELGYKKAILETGKNQLEALGLYKGFGYKVTENYGQYIGVEYSVCFEKDL